MLVLNQMDRPVSFMINQPSHFTLQDDVLRRGGVREAGPEPGGGGEGRHGEVGARALGRRGGDVVGRGAGASDGGRGECC